MVDAVVIADHDDRLGARLLGPWRVSCPGSRSWYRYRAHARGVQVTFDRGLAVAAVGGYRAGHSAGAAADAFDGGCQLRAVEGAPAALMTTRRSIALILSPVGLLLISAGRLIIVSNFNTTTAVTIASSGGFVNTLLGTVIPLVPTSRFFCFSSGASSLV